MGMGGLGGLHHLFQSGLRLAVGNVFPHRALFQPGVLQHHAEVPPQALPGQLADVAAVHLDRTAVHIVKPHKQVNHRGFAAACGAHQSNALAGLHVQAEVLNEPLPRLVGKGDLLHPNAALRLAQGDGVRSIGELRLLLHELEHPGGAGQGVLQLGNHPGNLVKGLGVLVGIA